MNKQQPDKLDNLKGTIIIIDFFISFILLMLPKFHNAVPFIFGQLFFIAALMFLSFPDKSNLPVLCHLTIGWIFMDIIPFTKIPKGFFTDLNVKGYLNIILFIISIILGYVFIVVHKFVKNKKDQKLLYIGSWLAFLSSFFILYRFSWPYLF